MGFVTAYKVGLIECLLEEKPNISICEVSLRTGLDRRVVSQYFSEKDLPLKERRNKLAIVLSEMARLKHQYYPSGYIPRRGTNSFDSICNRYAKGDHSAGSILKELVRLGNVKNHGDWVELINSYPTIRSDAIDFLELLAWNIDQLTKTALHNRNTDDRQQRLFHRMIYSTQIPFESRIKAEAEIKNVLDATYQKIHSILESYELPLAAGTFDPVGVSLFQFSPLSAQADSRRWGEGEA